MNKIFSAIILGLFFSSYSITCIACDIENLDKRGYEDNIRAQECMIGVLKKLKGILERYRDYDQTTLAKINDLNADNAECEKYKLLAKKNPATFGSNAKDSCYFYRRKAQVYLSILDEYNGIKKQIPELENQTKALDGKIDILKRSLKGFTENQNK